MMPSELLSVANDPSSCYGCGACSNACHAGAIKLSPDGDGFLRPFLDGDACVSCGKCAGVCPRLHPVYSNDSPESCLAVMASDDIRKESSSGGVFTLLADYVLRRRGVVFGAEMRDDFLVQHAGIDSKADLSRLRGSKYAQSDPGMTYREAKAALDAGRPVLYSGCPCQIAALNNFLGREYDNLITIDILCSGNPSAYGLREYMDDAWGLENIASMSFRNLEGWDYRFEAALKSGEVIREPESPYLKMFLEHALSKPACASCAFQKLPRQADFTIGDFWNVRTLDKSMDDGLGTSVVLLNNSKARKLWRKIGSRHVKAVREFSVEDAYQNGVTYLLQGPAPYAKQDTFDRIRRERGFAAAVRETAYHYDVGIAGTWFPNFGTISTNWALHNVIRSFGLTACILDVTGNEWLDGSSGVPKAFIDSKGIPRASAFCKKGDYSALNQHCDKFVTASDQLWGNIPTYLAHEEFLHLGFADPGKPLIAVGTGLGASALPFDGPRIARRKNWLSRFDYIGLREDFGPDLAENMYGADAEHIQDPVFLCDRDLLIEEARHTTFEPSGKFVFAYVLYKKPDDPEFAMARKIARAMGCGLITNVGLGAAFEEYDADLEAVFTREQNCGKIRIWKKKAESRTRAT